MNETAIKSDRRSFLKKVCKIFSAAGLFLSAGFYLLVAYPKHMREKKISYIYACEEQDLPVQGVRQYLIEYTANGNPLNKKVFIVNTGRELFSLSSVCTHLGCLITWYRPENRFLCPCHGGQYDIQGQVVAGPPPAPLHRLPLKIEKGKVNIGLVT